MTAVRPSASGGGRLRVWRARQLGVAAPIAIVLVIPLVVTSNAGVRILVLIAIYAGLAAGLNLLVGYTGLLDLGFVAFFAIGAYTTAISYTYVVSHAGAYPWWLPYVSLVPGALLGATVAAILGYPTLRARGDYLAIMTLGLGEIVRLFSINLTDLTGGPNGLPGIAPFSLGPMALNTPVRIYYVTLVLVACVWIIAILLIRSKLGRGWVAIREDWVVAESIGVRTTRYKLFSYMSGGFIGGWVGVIYAHTQGYINPDSFSLDLNFVVLGIVILGGAGYVLGPLVGAVLWVGLDQLLGPTPLIQAHPELREIVLGAVVILALAFFPNGLVGFNWARVLSRFRRGDDVSGNLQTPDANGDLGAASSAYRSTYGLQSILLEGGDSYVARVKGNTLEAQGISCRYGGLIALSDIRIAVGCGEIVGVIGPNGAGKSTLLNVLSGVQVPSDGVVAVDGAAISLRRPSDAARVGIARTFQLIRILPGVSVIDNVLLGGHLSEPALGYYLKAGTGKGLANDASELCGALGLSGALLRNASELSYGEQRRLEIARALMLRPRWLLLDEPVAGMNISESAALADTVRMIRDCGVGVLLVEHDLRFLTSLADRVVAFDHGEQIASGSPAEVISHERVVASYLGGSEGIWNF